MMYNDSTKIFSPEFNHDTIQKSIYACIKENGKITTKNHTSWAEHLHYRIIIVVLYTIKRPTRKHCSDHAAHMAVFNSAHVYSQKTRLHTKKTTTKKLLYILLSSFLTGLAHMYTCAMLLQITVTNGHLNMFPSSTVYRILNHTHTHRRRGGGGWGAKAPPRSAEGGLSPPSECCDKDRDTLIEQSL